MVELLLVLIVKLFAPNTWLPLILMTPVSDCSVVLLAQLVAFAVMAPVPSVRPIIRLVIIRLGVVIRLRIAWLICSVPAAPAAIPMLVLVFVAKVTVPAPVV